MHDQLRGNQLTAGVGVSIRRQFHPVYNMVAIATIFLYYKFIFQFRLAWEESDLFRIVDEFSSANVEFYHLREPLFWVPLKIVGSYLSPELTLFVIDLFLIYIIYRSLGKISLGALITLPLTLISPFFLLGFGNIYRQLVAFIVFVTLYELCCGDKVHNKWLGLRKVAMYIIPGLIHNSLFIFSFVAWLLEKKSTSQSIFLLFAFMAIYYFAAYLPDVFREGTETNTSIAQYALISLVYMISILPLKRVLKMEIRFIAASIIIGLALFLLSGPSSGSRIILMSFAFGNLLILKRDVKLLYRFYPYLVTASLTFMHEPTMDLIYKSIT